MNCPECQSVDIIKITYGTPSLEDTEMINKIKSGLIILGGCGIDEHSPAYYCKKCKHRFGNYVELKKGKRI